MALGKKPAPGPRGRYNAAGSLRADAVGDCQRGRCVDSGQVDSQADRVPGTVTPRLLKGFRDATPEIEVVRREYLSRLESVAQSFGYRPIETPAIEFAEVLLAKAGGDAQKEIYRFRDHGNRDVALRFDLTVPFARFMALHANSLPLPFKRYQSGKAWRGEKPQKGRYREFMQFDADVVGSDAAVTDVETLAMAARCAEELQLGPFRVRVSHRNVIGELLRDDVTEATAVELMRVIDKAGALTREELTVALRTQATPPTVDAICRLLDSSAAFAAGGNRSVLDSMEEIVGACEGITRLRTIVDLAIDQQPLSDALQIEPSIVRGFDYYTGVVFETNLQQMPDVGSIGSGGRYDDLVGLYSSQKLPGVGMSVGIDRVVHALADEGRLPTLRAGADVIVFCLDDALAVDYQRIAAAFRTAGLRTDVYPSARKLKAQFAYAELLSIPFGLFFGEEEQRAGTVRLKELTNRRERTGLPLADAVELVRTAI